MSTVLQGDGAEIGEELEEESGGDVVTFLFVVVGQSELVCFEVGSDISLYEIPGHEPDAVDESEAGNAVGCMQVDGVDDGGAFEP